MTDDGGTPRDAKTKGLWPGLNEDPGRTVENVCSQTLPEEKCSTAEFRSLLRQPEPSAQEECPKSAKIDPDNGTWPNCLPENNSINKQLKNSYRKRKKGFGSTRKSSKRANAATMERRRQQVIAYCKVMWRENNDLDTWRGQQDLRKFSRKRHHSTSDLDTVIHIRAEATLENIEKGENIEENGYHHQNAFYDEDLEFDVDWRSERMEVSENEDIPDWFNEANYDHADRQAEFDNLEGPMSDTDETMVLEERSDGNKVVPSPVENFVYIEGSTFYKLPRITKTFPSSPRALNVRVSALNQLSRALAQGAPSDAEDEKTILNELKIVNGLRSHLIKKLKETRIDEELDDPSKPVPLDVATAAFATGGIASGHKLRTVNGILRLAGRKIFPTDRIVLKRLHEKVDWVSWSTKEIYVNGELIRVAKADNLRDVLEKYVNTTWRTIDTTCPESQRKLMLRIGVDRGGGKTKIGVSLGNRKRLNNSPSNWMIVAVYDGKDDSATLRATVQEVFREFDDLTIDDLKLCTELRDHFDDIGKLLIGDFPSISAVLGVKGHAARNPCFLCTVEKGNLHTVGEMREYLACADKVQNGLHSHSLEPLLKRTYPVVPLLHSFMGPATSLFQRMEEDVKKVIVAKALGLPQSQWFEERVQVRTYGAVDDDIKVLRECVRNMKKLKRVESGMSDGSEDCAPWCSQRKRRNTTCWIKCNCGRWMHTLCMGKLPSRVAQQSLVENGDEGRTALEKDALNTCPGCENLNDSIPKILDSIDESYTLLQKERRSIDIVKNSADNGLFLTWEATCRKHNIFQGRFHGGALTGNQACDFLRAACDFLDAFSYADGVEARAEMYKNILMPLNSLHSFTRSRYLNEQEIQEIEVQQNKLKAAVLDAQWINFTPKIHLLCSHLGQLARMLGSIGLHSEQGVEHLHKLYASEELCFLQKQQPARSQAAAARLNAKNIELHSNPYTILYYKLDLREQEVRLENPEYDI